MSHHHPPSPGAGRPLLLAAALLSAASAAAGAQAVRYTVQPAASYLWWHDDLGLDRTALYGARAGVDFGRLVGLEGHWLTRGGLGSRADFLPGGAGEADGIPSSTDLMTYGLGVRLDLGEGRIAPFARGGASVFHFQPEGADDARFLALTYGAGLRFNISSRFRAQLFAEEAWLRLDRAALQPPGAVPPDPDRDRARRNLAVGAGLGVVLGPPLLEDSRRPERWSLASVPIEPFVGQLAYADDALGDQSLAGLRLGLDVGRYVGLRGYYWRGVNSGFSATEPVQSFGGEAQFNLNAVPVLAPYLILGGGTLEFRDDFRDLDGLARDDRTVVILGGGVGVRLTEQFRLNAAVRDYVYTGEGPATEASRTRDLRHNWLYSAGLTFSVGRGSRGVRVVRASESDSATVRRVADALETRAAERDSVARALGIAPRTRDTVWVTDRDGQLVEVPAVRAAPAAPATVAAPAERSGREGYLSDRTVTIPVPTEGELYVRYGRPPEGAPMAGGLGAAREQAVREQMTREQLSRELGARDSAAVARALLAVPLVRDSAGALVADTVALRETVRRMIEEERRAAGADTLPAPLPRIAPPPDDASSTASAAAAASDAERRLLARVDAAIAARQRDDAVRLRELVQQEVQWQVRAAAPATRELVVAAPPPAQSTVVLREGATPAVAAGGAVAAYAAAAQAATAERERTSQEVARLRTRLDSATAARNDAAVTAEREALRLAELADARAEAEAARVDAARAQAAAAEAERSRAEAATRLERLLAEVAQVRQVERGLTVVLADGAFQSGQATLTPSARVALGVVAAALTQSPADSILIEAHADSTGSAATNLRISQRRATAVRDALIAHGTPPDRIVARGLGHQLPIASNRTAAGRAMNRRAELLLVGEGWTPTGADRQP